MGSVTGALSACQPPRAIDESWGIQQLVLRDGEDSVTPSGVAASMSESGRTVAFEISGRRDRWAVADQPGALSLLPAVQKLTLPDDIPDSPDGDIESYQSEDGVISADGLVFVATLERDQVAALTNPAANPTQAEPWEGCNPYWYYPTQIIKWVRSSPTAAFGDAQLVSKDVGATEACPLPEGGAPAWWLGVRGSAESRTPSVSGDGGSVAFVTAASNFGVTSPDRFTLVVRDGDGLVSLVTPPDWDADVQDAIISADGLHIAFVTAASQAPEAGTGEAGTGRVYLATRAQIGGAWSFQLVSKNSSGAPFDKGPSGSKDNWGLSISGNGSRVGWLTASANAEPALTSNLDAPWVAVRDVGAGVTRLATKTKAVPEAYYFGPDAGRPAMSVDGKRIAIVGTGEAPDGSPSARVVDFQVDKLLDASADVRRDARGHHLWLPGLIPTSAREIGLAGPDGGYAVAFVGNPPLPVYEGSPPAVYLAGAKRGGFAMSRGWHGDPVDVASGAFAQSETDLTPSAGPSAAALSRSYSSLGSSAPVASLFGPGWSSAFDMYLDVWEEGRAVLFFPDGRSVGFTAEDDGSWSTTSGYRGVLTGSGPYLVTSPAGAAWQFDDAGLLEALRSPTEPEVTIAREPGKVTVSASNGYGLELFDDVAWSIDPGGSSISSPGQDGYVDRAVSSDGLVVDYGYGGDGGLITLTSVSRPHRAGEPAETIGHRLYESEGLRIRKISDEVGDGRVDVIVENTYDSWGRVVSQVNDTGDQMTFNYDVRWQNGALAAASGYTTVVNEASGDRVVYKYGADGELVAVEDTTGNTKLSSWNGDLATSSTSRSGVKTDQTYDAAGRVTQVTETVGGVSGVVSSTTYVVPDSSSAARADQRVATSTDAAGIMTTIEYSAAAGTDRLPWKVSVPCDPASLKPGLACPANGRTSTTYEYWTGPLDGLVKSSVDADGVRTDYEYWPDRSLKSTATHPDGSTTLTTRFATLRPGDPEWAETDPAAASVKTVTAPDDTVTATVFDAAGRVLEVRDPLYDGTTHKATRYRYWLNGDFREVRGPDDALTTFDTRRPGDPGWSEDPDIAEVQIATDPDGVATITKVDRSGDTVATQVGDPAVPSSLATTTNTYGPLGRLLASEGPDGVVTRYGYDVEGRVTQQTVGAPLGDPGFTTTTGYDPQGNVLSVVGPRSTDPDGVAVQSSETSVYDSAGRLSARIEGSDADPALRLMTSYHYDLAGRMWRTVEHRSGTMDPVAAPINPGDRVTETRYTLAGRTGATIEPPTDVPDFDWLNGNQAAKRITRYGFDGAGRQTSITDPADHTTLTDYDAAGRVESVHTPEGRVTTFAYDDAGHQTKVIAPSPTGTGTVTTLTTYFAGGQVETVTDPHVPVAGQVDPSTRSFTYTPAGRLHTVTDALEHEVTYDYDERGNRTSRIALDDAGNPVEESWLYDLADRVVTHTVPPPRTGAQPAVTTYAYDPVHGWLDTVTDPTGRVETQTHYNTGAIRSRSWAKAGMDTVTNTYWLNARGWTTKTRGQLGSVVTDTLWARDRVGQVVAMQGPTGDELTYTWDLAGTVREAGRPDGSRLRYSHDPAGAVTVIERSVGGGAFAPYSAYGHDDDGLLETEVLAANGGAQRSWERNDAGVVTTYAQTTRRSDGSMDSYQASLSWRPDGRLATEMVNGGVPTLYGYDDAGQLEVATGPNGSRTWAYGTRGNLLSSTVDGVATTYETNPNGTMASATTGSTTVTYAYDDASRRTQARTVASGTETRRVDTAFDTAGRLVSIVNNGLGANTWELRGFDGTDRVVASVRYSTAPTVTESRLWDSVAQGVPQVVASSRDGGATWSDVTVGPGGLIASTDAAGATTWFQTDPRGSVIELPSNPDVVDGPARYEATGAPATAPPDPIGATTRGYRGEQTAAGLVHLRARDYDPTTRQFLTPDPMDGVDGTPTLANPHHYANNDPLNQADPMGLRAGDGAISEGQIGAACDAVGGRFVYWADGAKVCMEPPPGRVEGGSCWPPMTPGDQAIVYHDGSCGTWRTEVVCKHGASIPGLNFICRNGDQITRVLTIIAVGALTFGAGAAAAVTIGGAAGVFLPTGGVLALAGGGTAASGIVLSPAAAGALVATYPTIQTLIHMANSSDPQQGSGPRDYSTDETNNWSATFNSERDARAFAREKLGADPFEAGPNKLRSADGRWQYRAKPSDLADRHIHLEQLDPSTGRIIQNVHLRW